MNAFHFLLQFFGLGGGPFFFLIFRTAGVLLDFSFARSREPDIQIQPY
jgi:hypothetical protein